MLSDMLTADGSALLGIFVCIFVAWLIQHIAFALIGTRTYHGESFDDMFDWYFAPLGLVMLSLAIYLFCVRMIAAYSVVVVIMQGKGFWLFLGFLVAYVFSRPLTMSEG